MIRASEPWVIGHIGYRDEGMNWCQRSFGGLWRNMGRAWEMKPRSGQRGVLQERRLELDEREEQVDQKNRDDALLSQVSSNIFLQNENTVTKWKYA